MRGRRWQVSVGVRYGLAVVVMALTATPSRAAERGLTYFAHGAQTVYAALMPPPGRTQFFGYTQFYDAGSLRDAAGDRIPGLSVQAIAMAPRVLHSWSRGLWGFNATSGVLALVVNVGVETPVGDEFDNGPVVFGIEPLYLSRSFGAWHVMFGTVFYVPGGSYDPQALANTTLNRYGAALNGALTWTPTPRLDVSLSYGYEFKGRNRDTGYRDGQQAGLTFGAGYRPSSSSPWDVGMSGYYTAQVEDDRLEGRTIADRRIRRLAVGPKLGYWFSPAAALVLQWHRDYEVRNAPRGDAYWLMFSLPLGRGA